MSSFDLNGINASAYTDLFTQQTANASGDHLKTTLQNAASKAKASDGGEEINEELMGACKQFEAYFLEQVFKEMQKSVDSLKENNSGSSSQLVNYFKDQTLQEVTKQSTETQGLGFAQMLYENMKHTAGMSAADIQANNEAIVQKAAQEQAAESAGEQAEEQAAAIAGAAGVSAEAE